MELDQDLQLDGDPAQRGQEQPHLLALADGGGGGGLEVLDRDAGEVEALLLARAVAEVAAELAVGDGEQVRAEAGAPLEVGQLLDAGEEGALDQVAAQVADLALKEPRDGVVVALEQLSEVFESGATFRAWLSDATGSPATRFDTTYTGHYQLVEGTPIASEGWLGLTSGALINPIGLTETGEQVGEDRVWTNTLASGEAASDLSCMNWSSNLEGDSSRYGRASLVDAKWTNVNQAPCDAAHHLYCVQDGPAW